MTREQLIPEGWKPRAGGIVVVEEATDDPAPPHGSWKIIDRAPGTGQWWLMPVDDAARDWLARFPGQRHLGGCIVRSGRMLVPRGYRRARPSDLSPTGLQRAAGGR